MPPAKFQFAKRYGFAIFAVAISTLVTFAIRPILGSQAHYLTFTLAVIASAWYGGLGPGLASTVIGFLSADYFFLTPVYSFVPVQADDVALLTSVGVSVSILAGRLSSARTHLLIATSVAGVGTFEWSISRDRIKMTPEMAKLYGLKPERLAIRFQELLKHIHPDDAPGMESELKQAMADRREEVAQEFRIILPNGKVRWIESRCRFIYGTSGIPIRSIGANIDITERREREAEREKFREAERARMALAASNEDLQRFAYAISHDLQQPLRTISVFTQLLLVRAGSILDKETLGIAETITKGAEEMNGLIKGLLEFCKVSYGEPSEVQCVDSGAVLQKATELLASAIAESGARITAQGLPEVRANRDLLLRVFLNLLSNAIKYRSSRPLEIRVAAEPLGDKWRFSVTDNGIGIDPQYHEQIFGIFKRLHSSSQYTGAGIGLAVVRRIVERAGGGVWVDSQPNLGSTFYFTVPQT